MLFDVNDIMAFWMVIVKLVYDSVSKSGDTPGSVPLYVN